MLKCSKIVLILLISTLFYSYSFSQDETVEDNKEMNLKGIMKSGSNYIAMIDDKMLKKGDTFKNYHVTEIKKDSVILNDGEKEVVLKLERKGPAENRIINREHPDEIKELLKKKDAVYSRFAPEIDVSFPIDMAMTTFDATILDFTVTHESADFTVTVDRNNNIIVEEHVLEEEWKFKDTIDLERGLNTFKIEAKTSFGKTSFSKIHIYYKDKSDDSYPPSNDKDGDGMPDDWERKHGIGNH